MKDIRPAIRSYLLDDPVVSDLVGGERIHSSRLPQGQTDPSVVYVKISEIGDYNMAGDSSLSQMRIQFDSWAETNDEANLLSNAVYDRMSGAHGLISSSPNVEVRGSFLVGGREDYDEIMQMFRVSRDFVVWYLVN